MSTPWTNWRSMWERFGEAARRMKCSWKLQVAKPATAASVVKVEKSLGRLLPESFRDTLLGFSRKVSLRWQLPEGIEPPGELRQLFGGQLFWDLDSLVDLEKNRLEWIRVCFPDAKDPYDVVWHQKLPFLHVANGDLLAIDESGPARPVVYLSHDAGEGHGLSLGSDFADYVTRLSELGCPGAEDWQWLPFRNKKSGLVNPNGAAAKRWRKWMGMSAI